MRVNPWTLGCSAVAFCFGCAAPAFANDASQASPPSEAEAQQTPSVSAAEAADAQDEDQVILVVGRKRAEALQDVPTAVSAFTDDQIQREGIRTIDEIVERAPGVSFATIGAPFADQISIRGQGAARQINAEAATGIYRNGAFIVGGNVGGGNLSRLDMFDVERIEVYRGPQGALFGRNAVGGAINVISARPTAFLEGFAEAGYGENDRFEFRGVLNAPLSDSFWARLSALYLSQDDGFFTNTLDGEVLDDEEAFGLRLGLRFEPSDETSVNFTFDYFDEETGSLAIGTFNPNVPGDDPFNEALNAPSRFDREEFTGILEISHDLGFAELSSLTFLKSRDASTVDDLDAFLNIPVPLFSNLARTNSDDFTRWGQELRLVSGEDGPLTWVIGGEVLRLENESRVEVSGAPPPAAFQNSISFTVSRDWNYAVYGLLGYDFSPAWNLTGELRYSRDEKDFDLTFTSFSPTGVPTTDVSSLNDAFDNFSPVATLSYTPSDALHFYGRVATGFRAGGFNFIPDPQTPARFDLPFDEENAISYELGTKTSFADGAGRFNIAAYRVDTDDVLINRTQVEGVRIINFVDNLGESRIYGIEAEASALLPLGGGGAELRFDLAGSWNDSEFTDGPFDGFALPFVRDWQASITTSLTAPLTTSLELFAVHNFRGQWGGWEDEPTNRPLDDIELHDVRLGVRSEHWSLVGEIENVGDDLFVIQRLNPNVHKISRPRRWMLRLRVNY